MNSTSAQAIIFNQRVDVRNLLNLGFKGTPFTWQSKHNGDSMVYEWFDRALVNDAWRLCFSEAMTFHLPQVFSDNKAILIDLNYRIEHWFSKPFQFEAIWTTHKDFEK